MSLKARLPFAVGKLPTDALVALTKAPPPGGCAWCCALVQRLPDRPELERNPVTLALLGDGCQSCRTRWGTAAVAARERDHAARLAAAGFRPEAAGRLRTPEQVAAYQRALESFTARPPAPTGAMWPAGQGQPAAVTAAVQAATRQPLPPFYGSRRAALEVAGVSRRSRLPGKGRASAQLPAWPLDPQPDPTTTRQQPGQPATRRPQPGDAYFCRHCNRTVSSPEPPTG